AQQNLKDTRGINVVKEDWKFGDWGDLALRYFGTGLDVTGGAGIRLGGRAVTSLADDAVRQFERASVTKQQLRQTADQIEQTVTRTPTSQLGKLDDGISSPVVAQAKRENAQATANQLRQEADSIA